VSPDSVRAELAVKAPDLEIVSGKESTATVEEAASVHGVAPGQIAKTLCVQVGERVVLVVLPGTGRLDNKRTKAALGGKPRFLDAETVMARTSHPVGGVCPFGLPEVLPVYCDVGLRAFETVIPAAGAVNASVILTPERLGELTGAEWVDVVQ